MNTNPKNNIFKSYGLFWKNFFNFKGRTRRSDFWNATIINIIIEAILSVIYAIALNSGNSDYTAVLNDIENQPITADQPILLIAIALIAIYAIAIIIPCVAMIVRRLHDIGKTGWLILLSLVPCIGAIILFVFEVMDSEKGENKYGVSDKYIS